MLESDLAWDLRDTIVPLTVKNHPYDGYIEFNLATIQNCDPAKWWAGTNIPANGERWRRAWTLTPVPNGDSIALDVVAKPENPPVVYLCHEEPENDYHLGEGFDEFMEDWTRLGCVGPELWYVRHFLTDMGRPLLPGVDGTRQTRLDPTYWNSKTFMGFFGL